MTNDASDVSDTLTLDWRAVTRIRASELVLEGVQVQLRSAPLRFVQPAMMLNVLPPFRESATSNEDGFGFALPVATHSNRDTEHPSGAAHRRSVTAR